MEENKYYTFQTVNITSKDDIKKPNPSITFCAEMGVQIPSKRDEDAGYDIYTIEDGVVLKPLETRGFRTGLRSSFNPNFWVEIKERGSTGAAGLSVRSGVIDSGFRGEWMIMLTNVNRYDVEFSSAVDKVTKIYSRWNKKKVIKLIYPISKAIAQAVVVPLPLMDVKVVTTVDELGASERGDSGWGASGK